LRWGLELFGLGDLAQAVSAPEDLVALAEKRQEARANGDFDDADRLRSEIEDQGWEVRDVDGGFELVPK
jgi:cysteinyl-tRNA synthetase